MDNLILFAISTTHGGASGSSTGRKPFSIRKTLSGQKGIHQGILPSGSTVPIQINSVAIQERWGSSRTSCRNPIVR